MPLPVKHNFKFKYDHESLTNVLIEHLYNLKDSSSVSPFRLFVYPSALCNDSCRYCSDGARAGSEISDGFLKYDPARDFFEDKKHIDKLVNDIKDLEVRDIHLFGGGEPFFYKENMFYFLERLKETDVFIRIITNANNLVARDVDYIVKNGLISSLNISFNTDSEEAAGKLYANSARHTHSLEVLETIASCKQRYDTDFPKINIMCILLNTNYNRIPEILELVGRHKPEFFSLQPLRCGPVNPKDFVLSCKQEEVFRRQIPQIEEKLKEFKLNSNLAEFKSELPADNQDSLRNSSVWVPELKNKHGLTLRCYLPLVTLAISYNGSIPYCFFKNNHRYRYNYFELNSLKEFIRSREYAGWMDNFTNSNLPEFCADCNFCSFYEFESIKERFEYFKRAG